MNGTYTISHEAWYRSVVKEPSISVHSAADDGGVYWEFQVTWYSLSHGRYPRIEVFDDAFVAFDEARPFFDAVAAQRPQTVEQMAAVLDGAGFTDVTPREAPA